MNCTYCNRNIVRAESLEQHTIFCSLNPNRLTREDAELVRCKYCDSLKRNYLIDSHYKKCKKNPENKPDPCKFCGKNIDPRGIKFHQMRCEKNPEKIEFVNSSRQSKTPPKECKFCGDLKNIYGLKNHERFCKKNPERKDVTGENHPNFGKFGRINKNPSNQYIKAKKLGLPKPEVSEETRMKFRNKTFSHTKEARERISKGMKEAVLRNPDSYSASNVSGRTKTMEYNGFKLKGSWELLVAKWFDSMGIKWTNVIDKPFEYEWEGKTRYYFPDFFLPNTGVYIEVKGYEREQDRAKWKSLENLIVIRRSEIDSIKKELSSVR